jgi:drug/metabolite transporter (DMT)-like permease
VLYKHLLLKHPSSEPQYRRFGFFYVGALLIALPAFLLLGNGERLPSSALQWGVLVWLGVVASGLGLYWWNKGASMVEGGTLAVMNNALVPAGLLVNLLIWNHDADLLRLALGGAVIAASLPLLRLGRHTPVEVR